MKTKTCLLGVVLLSGLAPFASAGSDDQVELRRQMATFWGIAESRVAEPPPPPPPVTIIECALPSGNRHQAIPYVRVPATSHCGNTSVTATPALIPVRPTPSTVQAHQSARSDSREGGFGLTLFGQVRLFDFTWRNEGESSQDELRGHL